MRESTESWSLLIAGAFGVLAMWICFKYSLSGYSPPGDDAASAIFTGLGFVGLLVTLKMQSTQLQLQSKQTEDQSKQLEAQKIEANDLDYRSRVDAVVDHYKSFFAEPSVQARRLSWPCIQRAYYDEKFRQYLAAFSHVPTARTASTEGSFILRERPQDGEYKWHHATHQVDEVLAYFLIFAARIRSCEEVARRLGKREGEFEELVRRMNVYWPWWGPTLRYVACLRKNDAESSFDAVYGSLDFFEDFDTLDRFLLKPGKRLSGKAGEEILSRLYVRETAWLDVAGDNKPGTEPAVLRDPFSLTRIGVPDWYADNRSKNDPDADKPG